MQSHLVLPDSFLSFHFNFLFFVFSFMRDWNIFEIFFWNLERIIFLGRHIFWARRSRVRNPPRGPFLRPLTFQRKLTLNSPGFWKTGQFNGYLWTGDCGRRIFRVKIGYFWGGLFMFGPSILSCLIHQSEKIPKRISYFYKKQESDTTKKRSKSRSLSFRKVNYFQLFNFFTSQNFNQTYKLYVGEIQC